MRGGKMVMAAMLAVVLAGCGGNESEPEKAEARPEVTVRTGEVESIERMRTQGLPGTVYPSDRAIIAAKLMATVSRVEVTIGERVLAGDILLVLDAGEVQAQVEQAEAALAQLERNYEREQALFAQSATTAETVRTLEDEIRVARARRSEARTMESYTRIQAPFDGVITTKEVKRGDLALPGVPLMSLEGIGSLEVHVQVPDSLLAISHGETVEVSDRGNVYPAELTEWSPAADPASRTRLAKLSLSDDSPLRSGQYVRVSWPAEVSRSLWIPAESLAPIGQIERVFVFKDERIDMRIVKTGLAEGDRVQVLAGLEAGERVVLSPENDFHDGQPARLTQ